MSGWTAILTAGSRLTGCKSICILVNTFEARLISQMIFDLHTLAILATKCGSFFAFSLRLSCIIYFCFKKWCSRAEGNYPSIADALTNGESFADLV